MMSASEGINFFNLKKGLAIAITIISDLFCVVCFLLCVFVVVVFVLLLVLVSCASFYTYSYGFPCTTAGMGRWWRVSCSDAGRAANRGPTPAPSPGPAGRGADRGVRPARIRASRRAIRAAAAAGRRRPVQARTSRCLPTGRENESPVTHLTLSYFAHGSVYFFVTVCASSSPDLWAQVITEV